jgi:type II secretory pathway pseudopilin PulG
VRAAYHKEFFLDIISLFVYCFIMRVLGYSLIEILGAIALVVTLVVIAIPSIRSFSEGGKQGAAARNVAALNSAVAQYDQSGGLLTARVTVLPGVEDLPVAELPEMKVLNLLRGADGESLISAWQEPVFSNEGYRVIWVNDYQGGDTQITLGGERNAGAESMVSAGNGARFELIGPTEQPARKGIVGFQRGELLVASTVEAAPTPVPVPSVGNRGPSTSLTPDKLSAPVGVDFVFFAAGTDPDGDTLEYNFMHEGGQTGWSTTNVFSRNFYTAGIKQVGVQVRDNRGGTAQAQTVVTAESVSTPTPTPALATPTPTPFQTPPTPAPSPAVVSGLNRAPTITLMVNKPKGVRGEEFTFTATGKDLDGDRLQYRFRVPEMVFAGGSPDGWTTWEDAQTIKTKFADLGTKKVEAQVRDSSAVISAVPLTVQIENLRPTVTISGPSNVMRTKSATFRAEGKDGDKDAIQYSFRSSGGDWSDFGGSNTFTQAFSSLGAQKVFVRAKDAVGTISDPAVANIEVTPDTYVLSANVVVMGSDQGPGSAITLTGISTRGQKLPAGVRHKFQFAPKAGWVIESVSRADGFTKTNHTRLNGGGASVMLNQDTEVTIKVKPRPIAYYWNRRVAGKRGDVYPAADVDERGQSFRQAVRTAGHARETIAKRLGEENWTRTEREYLPMNQNDFSRMLKSGGAGNVKITETKPNKFEATGGGVQFVRILTAAVQDTSSYNSSLGTTAKKAGMKEDGQWVKWKSRSGHTWVYWVTKKRTLTYSLSKSENIVMVDAETGQLLGQKKVDNRPAMGHVYKGLGKITGIATGSDDVKPAVKTIVDDDAYWKVAGSPIMVDLNGDGLPGLLSGGDWEKSPRRAMVTSAFRKFKLDGENEQLWEWISNEDGLLVHNPDQLEVFEVTGKDLFGHYSFGEKWKDGYEALATLDKNGDGTLEGAELDSVWIWQDANMDAKVQKGELTPSKGWGIVTIFTKPDYDDLGNAMLEQGVRIGGKNGEPNTILNTWDWISYGGLDVDAKLSQEDRENIISEYRISAKGLLDGSQLCFGPSQDGYAVFWTIKPNEFTTQSDQFKLEDNRLSWTGTVIDGNGAPIEVQVSATLSDDGNSIAGKTIFSNGVEEEWSGQRNGGLPLTELRFF